MEVAGLAKRVARSSRRAANGVSYRREPSLRRPISQACTFGQIESPEYVEWCRRLELPTLTNRKLWEWCFILQVLEVSDMLRPGRTGLGFGVGHEPMTALAAARGCEIVATDAPSENDRTDSWRETGQHAEQLSDLNYGALCPADVFERNVTFRPVDMRAIPDDLGVFDFTWSSCAMEHLGTIDAGLGFLERQLDCLKPGGIGVHTTELNVDADGPTLSEGHTVLYQRKHIESLVRRMRKEGHPMQATFALGAAPEDLHVDIAPYTNTHIRTKSYDFIHTSFGLVVRKK